MATRKPSKPKAAPKTSAEKPSPPMSDEELQRLVAEAAYFRAQRRGFAPGYELQDWVEAEAEVKRLIGRSP